MISIVDDDESVREAMRRLVRSLGYAATTFTSAEEYLHSDHVERTSCLISDVKMPGMSGVELQARLIADGRGTPIIFITAFPEERVRARVLQAGAIGYLSKPLGDECLLECLAKALASDACDAAGREAQR